MKRVIFLCIIICSTQKLCSQAQNEFFSKVYFSEQIATNINYYKYEIGKAKAAQDTDEMARLYKEFINQKLIGSYLDDFNVACFDRKKSNLGDFDKPLVLLTYADWCGPIEDQIEIFNAEADLKSQEIHFLVLIWGDKKIARKLSKPFHKKTDILYVNELRNRDEHTIRMLKHALGVPTLIVTNSDKKIVDIIKLTPSFPNLFEHDFEHVFHRALNVIKTN